MYLCVVVLVKHETLLIDQFDGLIPLQYKQKHNCTFLALNRLSTLNATRPQYCMCHIFLVQSPYAIQKKCRFNFVSAAPVIRFRRFIATPRVQWWFNTSSTQIFNFAALISKKYVPGSPSEVTGRLKTVDVKFPARNRRNHFWATHSVTVSNP